VRLLGYAVAVAALALAGCGGEREDKKEAEESGRGPLTCTGSASADVVAFPAPDAVTFVKASRTGPTSTYDGYSTATLDDTFDGFKSAFGKAGFEVEKTDHEEHDAELEYKAKGGKREGQVALRECDNGHTSVHITNRPS
jgi:hypothetical protein